MNQRIFTPYVAEFIDELCTDIDCFIDAGRSTSDVRAAVMNLIVALARFDQEGVNHEI